MSEDKTTDNFEALQKQMAKDALEKALKALHSEITSDIERNKTVFSEEIKKTLAGFKKNLEQNVAEEMEHQLSALFDKHFQNTNTQIKNIFREMLSPMLEKIKEDMQILHTQGEKTLQTWKEAVSLYTHFWVKPAFLWMLIAIFTGIISSLLLSYFVKREEQEIIQTYQKSLASHERTIEWCYEKVKSLSQEKKKPEALPQSNNQTKTKKKPK